MSYLHKRIHVSPFLIQQKMAQLAKTSALILGRRDWRHIIDDEKCQKHSKLIDDCQFALNPCRGSCTPHTTFRTRTLQKSNCNGAGFRLCACTMNDWRTDRVTEKMVALTWKPLKTVVERPSVKYYMVGYQCRTHRQKYVLNFTGTARVKDEWHNNYAVLSCKKSSSWLHKHTQERRVVKILRSVMGFEYQPPSSCFWGMTTLSLDFLNCYVIPTISPLLYHTMVNLSHWQQETLSTHTLEKRQDK